MRNWLNKIRELPDKPRFVIYNLITFIGFSFGMAVVCLPLLFWGVDDYVDFVQVLIAFVAIPMAGGVVLMLLGLFPKYEPYFAAALIYGTMVVEHYLGKTIHGDGVRFVSFVIVALCCIIAWMLLKKTKKD